MKRILVLIAVCLAVRAGADEQYAQLSLLGTVPLANVEGGLGGMTVDPAGQKLYVAATDNNSIEVVDLRSNTKPLSRYGLPRPVGVAWLTGLNQLAVACSGDGTVRFFDGEGLRPAATVTVGDLVNGLEYDEHGRQLYASFSGGVAVISLVDRTITSTISVGGRAAGMRLNNAGTTLFVNVPSKHNVVLVDVASKSVRATWSAGASENVSMALGEADDYLFVGCRKPAAVVAYSIGSGTQAFHVSIGTDVGDVSYEPKLKRIYASCGSGAVSVYEWVNVNSYKRQPPLETARGARSSLLISGMGMFIVGVPARAGDPAEIRIYSLIPH